MELHPDTSQPQIWGFWKTLAWGIPILLAAVLFQTLGAVGFLAIWRFLHPQNPIRLAEAISNGGLLATALALSAPLVILVVIWIVRLSKVPVAEYLALKWPSWRELAVGIAGLVIVLGITNLAAAAMGEQTPEFITDTFNSARAAGLLPLLVFSFVFLGPLQEELVFRGFFLAGFAPAIGAWPAIVLTSAVWAVSHGQYEWFFIGEIFALGLLFGWLRWRSGSTLLTFILHALVNGMAVVAAAAGAV